MDNVSEILTAGVVFSIAGIIHGLCGFGFSLFAVGILSLILGPKTAVPLDLIAASANCFYLMWLLRKDIIVKETVVIVVLTCLFVPLGAHFLNSVDSSLILRTLGAVIITAAVISLLGPEKLRLFAARPFQYIAGVLGGLLGGAFNVPGPPLVVYAYNSHWPLRNAMANLQFIFSVMTLIAIPTYFLNGLLTLKITGYGILYIPVIIACTFIGSKISRYISSAHLRKIVMVVLVLLGANLMISG